jgi:hypothetical protein
MSDIVDRLCHPIRIRVAKVASALDASDIGGPLPLHEPQIIADMAEAAALIVQLRATIEQLRSVAGSTRSERM